MTWTPTRMNWSTWPETRSSPRSSTSMRRALSEWERETGDVLPAKLSPDEFDRETGDPLQTGCAPGGSS